MKNKFMMLGLVGCLMFGMAACKERKTEEDQHRGSPSNHYMSSLGGEVRLAIIRMVLSGVPIEKLRFNYPDEFDTLDDVKYGVFHPDGGGVNIRTDAGELMADGVPKRWYFNAEFEIDGIGDNGAKGRSEVIAFNVGIKKKVCDNVNFYAKLERVPRLQSNQSALYTKRMIDDGVQDYVAPMGRQPELDHPDLRGKVFGCFQSFDGKHYVSFTTVLER